MSPETIEVMVTELQDRSAIRENLILYLRGCDRQDAALVSSTYWPDSWDDHGLFQGSGDAFAQSMVPMWKEMKTHHMLGQMLIQIHAQQAEVESYFSAHHAMGPSGASTDILIGGRYNDRFEKRDGVWKVVHRVAVYDWWRTAGATEAWDTGFWKGLNLPAGNIGTSQADYSWELFPRSTD